MKHLSITISGQVQGVCFRSQAKKVADSLSLVGSIENRQDGTVYMEIEGEEAALDTFLEWCSHGPSRAVVQHVDVSSSEKLFGYSSCRIL